MTVRIDDALHYLERAKQCLIEEKEVLAPIVLPTAPVMATGLQNAAAFYDHIRGDVGELFPQMSEDQFKGIDAVLQYSAGKLPLGWCAYVLATDYHETGTRMVGVREGFDVSDAWRKAHLKYYPWYGRGLVQLTWEPNYILAGQKLGVNLATNPDLALQLDIAVKIIVEGMLEGWFSGKKLRDYIGSTPTREQYKNARLIVNAHDKDDLIAGYAVVFEEALKLGEWK